LLTEAVTRPSSHEDARRPSRPGVCDDSEVRVLLAPDAFDGSGSAGGPDPSGVPLTARQVGEAMALGWRRRRPEDAVRVCPLSDGRTGFIDAMEAARGGELVPVTVPAPLGGSAPATILLIDDPDGVPTAYLDSTQACGPQLLDVPDAGRASSHGVGELVRRAVDLGVRRVVVGVGASASHDGGAGLLAALGAGPPELLARGGDGLLGLPADALPGLAAARQRMGSVELVVATTSGLALTGLRGASASEASARGATATQAQHLEAALGHFADVAQRSLRAGRLLAGSGLAGSVGAGAGGGIGFALLLLGGQRRSAVDVVLSTTGLADQVDGSDLVVTGERVFGWDSLGGGVVAAVAAAGQAVGVPVVVVAQQVLVGRREALRLGVQAAYALTNRPGRPGDPATGLAGALAERAGRVAGTWSTRT
jgi:glycerate 2-kinase